jgi:phosphoglycolate phosphatase-like HAD superfamily hydrolase
MKALFWDFDGTLVDSRLKNYQVTKKIVENTTNKDPMNIPFLKSFENYKSGIARFTNWRDIYKNGINLSDEETDQIGRLWTEYQLNDSTHTPLFSGINEVVTMFSKYPNVIISQNSRQNILQILNENQIVSHFKMIIGFEEVDIRKQKPDPAGLIKGIDDLSLNNHDLIYYIGDHETDVVFANNAAEVLKSRQSTNTIISIGAFYGNDQSVTDWRIRPNFIANTPNDIIQIING